ncbi:MAG TPA: hypothetical protein GX739_08310, partial [Firmicutes bacterium]|nr:hypothetical protein [Bacillota bacterium]
LNLGKYGEEFLDYDASHYISDVISFIAEANIDIYTHNLWEWARVNHDWIEAAIDYGYYSISPKNFDLMDLFKAGQYVAIMDDIYSHLDDIVAYIVLEEVEHEFINKKRLVEVIDGICFNVDTDATIEYYIEEVRDEMESYPMLKIYLMTGTAWTESILVEGTEDDDLLELIEEYYLEHGDLPVPMYTLDEVIKGRTFRNQEEEWEYIDSLGLLSINGGEYYIDGIAYIEEVI